MHSPRFAMALATAMIAFCPTLPRAEVSSHVSVAEWRQADSLTMLISTLENWLDAQTDWPRRDRVPQVRLVSAWQGAARQGATASFQRGRLRGLYDPERSSQFEL